MKICPECGSHKVIMFDSDNDLCEKCGQWFPAVGEEKCVAGCKNLKNKEIRHHKDCLYYPKSLSKMLDDCQDELRILKGKKK